ncbi:MAG: hypothetical protein Q9191_007518 [Dirinaria sp. TL-2023a]
MHLKSHSFCILIAFLISCATAIVEVALVDTKGGFVYYSAVVDFDEYQGRRLPKNTAMKVGLEAYREMENIYKKLPEIRRSGKFVPKHKLPLMMTVMWIPEDGKLFIGSSATGSGANNFGYHLDNVPQQRLPQLMASGLPTIVKEAPAANSLASLLTSKNTPPVPHCLYRLTTTSFLLETLRREKDQLARHCRILAPEGRENAAARICLKL